MWIEGEGDISHNFSLWVNAYNAYWRYIELLDTAQLEGLEGWRDVEVDILSVLGDIDIELYYCITRTTGRHLEKTVLTGMTGSSNINYPSSPGGTGMCHLANVWLIPFRFYTNTSGKPYVYFLYFFLLLLTFLQKSRKSNPLYFFFTCQVCEKSRLIKYM